MVLSTTAAGTINQTALGFCSLFAKSWSEEDPTAFSWVSSFTALADMSKTTHWWPPLISRRTMFAPILPRPIIPSCIIDSFSKSIDKLCHRCHQEREGLREWDVADAPGSSQRRNPPRNALAFSPFRQ